MEESEILPPSVREPWRAGLIAAHEKLRRMTENGIKRRRKRKVKRPSRTAAMSGNAIHGLSKPFSPGPIKVLRDRLSKFHRDLPEIFDAYADAYLSGDPAKLERYEAQCFAANALIREDLVKRIRRYGTAVKEPVLDAKGRRVGWRVRVNPLLDALKSLNQDLGLTADQARLSRKSRGQGELADATADALRRDARLREAAQLAGHLLPAADPEILGEKPDAIDTEVIEDAEATG